MIVANLIDIYRTYRKPKNDQCSWPPDEKIDISMGQKRHPLTENFCFLTEDKLTLIETRLKRLLNAVEREYGSTAFVGRFYDKLDSDFKKRYPYPAEFYKALRSLKSFGAAESEGFRFQSKVKQDKIDAAFFIGYYLMLDSKPSAINEKGTKMELLCNPAAPFLDFIGDSQKLKNLFCGRIKVAELELERIFQ